MLRHDALRVNDLSLDVIAERIGERIVDDLKRPALVVALEVLYVLQHKRGGPVDIYDFRERKKEVALFLVLKTMRPSQAQFFGDARDAERLAWKPGAKNVVGRNVRHRHGMNVAMRRLAKIRRVGLLRVFVPVRRKNALTASFFKCESETANAAEQINKLQIATSAITVCAVRSGFFAQFNGFGFAPVLFL